ncbi:MerR family transcriptional regulator [Amycolatopsis minnesotensis]|uniref:MerR family transcriptional regulator n=1 Tax=Amycolatopsis minnesotensis TaxID=337894 RepID=A0ABN2RLP6_9PSEU
MQIGELASIAGVSTRAVRHYHQRGLLPEPPRRANGYRHYGLREVILLARIRRLTELGLTLDEVRDVLADEQGRDLHEILVGLDHDLARQETAIRDRRARLAGLIERAEAGALHADDPVSPETAALLGVLGRPGTASSPMARLERDLVALLDTAPDQQGVLATMTALAGDGEAAAEALALHRRLDELSEAPVGDPRVAPLAAELAASVPPEVVALIADQLPDSLDTPFAGAMLDSVSPAQAEVLRQAIRLLSWPR